MRETALKPEAKADRLFWPPNNVLDGQDRVIGRVLDKKYVIESLICRGGMGSVYLSRRRQIGDLVAVKVLKIDDSLDPVSLKRFQLEAASAASIKHPNVVSIYDFGLLEDIAYLVMERLEGPPLSNEIGSFGIGSIDRAITIFKQVCAAISAAHKMGIVHRDLKPSNIIFQFKDCAEDLVKVVDFGVVKVLRGNTEKLTDAGAAVGTPAYMSPEQCLGKRLDEHSDIYSLGVVLYEMLTGQLPFHDFPASAILIQHATQAPPSMLTINPEIPPQVDAVVQKALEKIPEKRYRSAIEMATEFELACRNASIAKHLEPREELNSPTFGSSIIQLSAMNSWMRKSVPSCANHFQSYITNEEQTPGTKVLEPMRFSVERFIGRENELGKLEECFEQAKTGHSRALFITGEPGVGKTELVNQFQRQLNPASALFLMGKFYEYGSDGPYRPYLDSLYGFIRTFQEYSPEGWAKNDSNSLTAKVKRGLDDLDSLINVNNSQAGHVEEQIKYRAFELLTAIFVTISKSFPLILFLDDVQWSDPLSLEFLAYFIINTEKERAFVICTARGQDILEDSRPIKTWLRRISRYCGYVQIRLEPLSETEVRILVDTLFGNIKIGEGVIRRLYEVTQGNPFYLGEIVHQLIQDQKIRWSGERWQCADIEDIELPGSILELVELRLRRLPDETLDVFTRAAVAGERFSFQLLRVITGMSNEELMDIIDIGLREHVIKETTPFIKDTASSEPFTDDFFIFCHSTLRKVLYERTSSYRRCRLHAQIGTKLEDINRRKLDRVAGELAYHFYFGTNYRKSFHYSVAAGEAARNIFAIEEAEKYYSWAESSLGRVVESGENLDFGPEWLGNFRLAYGNVLMHLGKNDGAQDQLDLALKISREAGLISLEGKSMQSLGELSWSRGQYKEALSFYDSALMLIKEAGDVVRECRLYGVMGDTYFSLGELDKAIEIYTRSLELASRVDDSSSEGEALRRIGSVFALRKQGQSALENLNHALAIAQAVGNRQSEWLVMMLIGHVYTEQDELKKAAEYYRHSLAITRSIGRRRGEGRLTLTIGEVYRKSGDHHNSKIYFNDARAIALEIEDRETEGYTLSNLGLVYEALGNINDALNSFQQAEKIFRATQHRSNVEVEALSGIARMLLKQGEIKEAISYFDRAVSCGLDLSLFHLVIPNLQSLAKCESRLGELCGAKERLSQAINLIKNLMENKTSDQEQKQWLEVEFEINQEIASLEQEIHKKPSFLDEFSCSTESQIFSETNLI